jgi:hypothetical protein
MANYSTDAEMDEMLALIKSGDLDAARELAVARAKNAELLSSGKGKNTLLKVSPEEFLDMEPKEGEALVMVKTIGGVECWKVNPKEDRRVSVSIENIWAYAESL